MTLEIIMGAFAYIVVGQLLWQKILMADITALSLSKCASEEEMHQHVEDRIFRETGEQNGDPAHLIAKASFILLWPLAIIYGIITARLL